MQPPSTPAAKVSALAARFTTAGYPHAFGGDVALAAHAGCSDAARIDLHVFVAPRESPAILARLAVLGLAIDRAAAIERIAVRGALDLDWAATPLSLRFGVDGLHALARPRVRRIPFADRFIVVLSPEDVLLERALAARRLASPRVEVSAEAFRGDLDVAYLRRSLAALDSAPPVPEIERLLAARAADLAGA
jgi:hypothetical protein